MGFVMSFSPVFLDYNPGGMTGWLITSIVAFAIVFAINSSIHSFLVVKYAKSDKVAVSVGFYYMSNALGRLMGTLGSGFIFTYVGEYFGEYVGHDGTAGLAACYFAGTLSSAAAAFITTFIDDNEGGLKCGNYTCVHAEPEDAEVTEEESGGDGESTTAKEVSSTAEKVGDIVRTQESTLSKSTVSA